MTNAPDCCVIAAIRIVNGSYTITAQGGEHAVLDADSGMTLNDLVLSGITLAFGELSDPPDTITIQAPANFTAGGVK